MEENQKNMDFIVKNSPDGGFLQSSGWRKFQEIVGRKTFFLEQEGFWASIIQHSLPIVGQYFYLPRGPIMEHETWGVEQKKAMQELIELAKKENAGWIRIEPSDELLLKAISEDIEEKIVKSPHDMQPKEIFVLDISKDADVLLGEMKPKTRYNINLAKKKNVKIIRSKEDEYINCFLRLTKEMAQRQGIVAHADEYYQKMIKSLPKENLEIYAAEFEGKIIAANLVLFFGKVATYMHGSSSNEHRNVMAPFLLQWQAILDAKERGCECYDFGGVKTNFSNNSGKNWEGITNFKLGFSPQTKSVEFPGSYDIILNSRAYSLYRGLQTAKAFVHKFRK